MCARIHSDRCIPPIVLAISILLVLIIAACNEKTDSSQNQPRVPATYTQESIHPTTIPTPDIAQPTPTPEATLTPTPDNRAGFLRGYWNVWSNATAFIWWTERDGQLSGQYQQTGFYPDLLDGEFEAFTAPFTGTRQGDQLTLVLNLGLGTSLTWSAVIEDQALILYIPDEDTGVIDSHLFVPGTAADYNKGVRQLYANATAVVGQATETQAAIVLATIQARATQRAIHNATATAVQRTAAPTQTAAAVIRATSAAALQQQRAVTEANRKVADALTQLEYQIDIVDEAVAEYESILSDFENDWATMQADNREMRAKASRQPLPCDDLYDIEYDLYNIEYGLYNIEYDEYSLEWSKDWYAEEVTALRQAIAAVQQAYAQLELAVAANTSGVPTPQFTSADISSAITRARTRLDTLWQVEFRAKEIRRHADTLLADAERFVASLSCSE